MSTRRIPQFRLARRAFAASALAAGISTLAVVGSGVAPASAALGFPVTAVAVIPPLAYGGTAPTTITFDGSGSYCLELCSLVAWNWSFGDGAVASGPIASHTYTASGLYNVTLTVTANTGTTGTSTTAVNIFTPTKANMTLSATRGRLPFTVNFDGSGSTTNWDRTIAVYAWNFGDGTTGSGVNVSHVYTSAGVFQPTLTVTDSAGGSQVVGNVVYVQDPMRPPTKLTATSPSKGTVQLKWTNRMVAVDHLTIERCAGSRCTNFVPVTQVPGTFTSATDSGLVSGTTYRYQVRVYDYLGGTGLSTIVSVKVR